MLGLRICESVAVGLHGEFESLEAMILGEVGHESTQGVWLGCRVCEDLLQVWQAEAKGGGQADGSGGRHIFLSLWPVRKRMEWI